MTGGGERPYVHPMAMCESDQVGAGSRIWAFAQVMDGAIVGQRCNIGGHAYVETGARIGDDVTVKNHVAVWDGVTLEDDVFVGPAAVFTNDRRPRAFQKLARSELVPTRVARGATVGAGAVVVCGVTIGEHAFVAAGSVVTGDVPAHALVAGHPARRRAWVCACASTLDEGLACPDCGRRYEADASGAPVPMTV